MTRTRTYYFIVSCASEMIVGILIDILLWNIKTVATETNLHTTRKILFIQLYTPCNTKKWLVHCRLVIFFLLLFNNTIENNTRISTIYNCTTSTQVILCKILKTLCYRAVLESRKHTRHLVSASRKWIQLNSFKSFQTLLNVW
jgi:hypothetical protein